jgi:hypothetical protein
MRRKARSAAITLALPALAVGLLAPTALASKTKYQGPLTGPPPQRPGYSTVFFKVISAGKGKKSHPVQVLKFKAFDVNVSCTYADGSRAQPYGVTYEVRSQTSAVNNREFAFTETFQGGHYGGPGSETFEIHGRIPRRGPATGTFRYSANFFLTDAVTCDSTTSWTAGITHGAFPE